MGFPPVFVLPTGDGYCKTAVLILCSRRVVSEKYCFVTKNNAFYYKTVRCRRFRR